MYQIVQATKEKERGITAAKLHGYQYIKKSITFAKQQRVFIRWINRHGT